MHSRDLKHVAAALCCFWLGLGSSEVAAGQATAATDRAALASEVSAEIQHLAEHATTIFVGQLVGIQRNSDVVEVSFRVEQPVRGAVGTTVVLREWAGTWAPGQNRYVVGQRVLAFLHGTSAAGLSSPVHGAEGLVPVVVQGANAPRLLDIRRVAASVPRVPGTPLPSEAEGAVPLDAVLASLGRGNLLRFAHIPLPVRGHNPSGPALLSAPARSQGTRDTAGHFASNAWQVGDALQAGGASVRR